MFLKKQYRFLVLALVVLNTNLVAQQLPLYSNYMVNNYVLNPAVGGTESYFEGASTNRYQWVGIQDAPRTYILSVNGPTKSMKVGLGGLLYTDIVGPTRRTGLSLTYAYHLNLSPKTKLSFGLSAGILQFRVDGSKIQLRDPSDVVITNGLQSVISPDFGVGIYLHSTEKIWYVGASAPQMLQNKIEFFNVASKSTNRLDRHYFVTGGYRFYLSEYFKIEPSTCIKYAKPAPVQLDLGCRIIYRNKFWIGSVYRTEDAVSALCGYSTKSDLTFVYSYDFTTSNIKNYSSGSHELMISIKFNKRTKKNTVIE